MNTEKLKSAFRRGVCRIRGVASTVAVLALDRLAKTPDGFVLVEDYLAAQRDCIDRVREVADPSRPSLVVTRLNDRGAAEFRMLYLEESSGDRSTGLTASSHASQTVNVSDQAAKNAQQHGTDPQSPPSRPLSGSVDDPSAAALSQATTEPKSTSNPTLDHKRLISITPVAPAQPPFRQTKIDMTRSPDALCEQSDIDLVRRMLTDHQAGQLIWHEDFIEQIDRHAHCRKRVLHMLRGDGRAGSDTDWVDTTTAGGSPVSWAGFQRIRTSLPLKTKLFVVGHVHECGPLESKAIFVAVLHVVTLALAHACIAMRKPGTPQALHLIEVKVSSRDLHRRAALYCDRGPVRLKIRLSRSLAATAPYKADLEDIYLDDPTEASIEEEIEWITTALRRRPPKEPEWCERSV